MSSSGDYKQVKNFSNLLSNCIFLMSLMVSVQNPWARSKYKSGVSTDISRWRAQGNVPQPYRRAGTFTKRGQCASLFPRCSSVFETPYLPGLQAEDNMPNTFQDVHKFK